jgi:uncharacterized protein YlxW (UPF0749 family)
MDLGSASRRKVLAQDVVAVMRVLEMALVLNKQETFSTQDLGKLRARNEELEGEVAKLETEEVTSLTKAMSDLKVEHPTGKKELEEKIVALQAIAAPTKDKPEEVKVLATRAELVAKIKVPE